MPDGVHVAHAKARAAQLSGQPHEATATAHHSHQAAQKPAACSGVLAVLGNDIRRAGDGGDQAVHLLRYLILQETENDADRVSGHIRSDSCGIDDAGDQFIHFNLLEI